MDAAEKLKEPTLQHVQQLMKGTPLVANMVVELAANGGATLPSCGTQIYEAVATNMMCRQQEKVSSRLEHITDKDMFAGPPENVKARLENLGHVALIGLRKRQFVFDMEEVVASCGREVMDYGFLEEFKHESNSQETFHNVEFRHRAWFEFFATYASSRMESPFSAIASGVKVVRVEDQTEPFWKFMCGLLDLKYLRKVLKSLTASYRWPQRTEHEKSLWVRLTCTCVAEAAHQLPSDVSLEKKLVFLKKACKAVFPTKVDVSNSTLSVVDVVMMSITSRHSSGLSDLNVSCCGLKTDHCKVLGSGLTHIQELYIDENPGLHYDNGLDMLEKVI